MASSSSSLPKRGWTHEVFLSFRGEDTRNGFVDHLYTAFVQNGIHPFKDDKMLREGKPISSELLLAIEESKFAVVVFSENYANSSWCLQELAKIMECYNHLGQKVLPVFYHVNPSDVRKQKGKFAVAFQEHESKFHGGKNELNKWREALTAVANLSGYHVSSVSGGESATINKIVQAVLCDTQARRRENNLVGMESHIHQLNSLLWLETTKEVLFIGIHGMGGVGKTTIARSLFKRILYKFEGSSFVNDVKGKRNFCAMQTKILKDILALNHDLSIEDPEDGADMIQERLCNKKVLLVLDNIDDVRQLEFLAATHEWFGPGSRIIITTRDERLLSHANAKYKPPLLTKEEALELFSKHAFKKNCPPKGYEELSNRAIRYTGHLPLAVKVLGTFFRGRQACVWGSALDRLAKTLNNEIFKTLKLSFDGLEEAEKKIFLDIACFYKGREVEYVTRLLRSFGFYPEIGISSLIEKSLISVSYGMVCMHELLQKMGLQIVHDTGEECRLWKIDVIQDLIKKRKHLEGVEASVATKKQCGNNEYDENMDFEGRFIPCEPIILSLCWNNHLYSSLPLEDMSTLVGLEMKFSNIKYLWEGQKMMRNLKFIHLYKMDFLTRFPDVSGAPNVESVIMSGCTELVEVDESLGFLKRLVHLDLSGCINLKLLPSRFELEFLEMMRNLRFSHLYKIDFLTRFPDVSRAPNGESVIMSGCTELVEVGESLGFLERLVHLDLRGCINLRLLPSRFELESMEVMTFSCFRSLQRFLESSECMVKVPRIKLSSCEGIEYAYNLIYLNLIHKELNLVERFIRILKGLKRLNSVGRFEIIPESILKLKGLKRLNSVGRFKSIPESIRKLMGLKCLISVERFESIQKTIRKLKGPKLLIIPHCSTPQTRCVMVVVINFHYMINFYHLRVLNFCHLRVLSLSGQQIRDQDFPNNLHGLSSLKILCLSGNSKLIQLPSSICHLSCLAYLDLSYCRRLRILQGLPSEIQVVDASNCISLKMIEKRVFMWVNPSDSNLTQFLVGISHLPRLEYLNLSFCQLLNLQVLPSEIHEMFSSLELIEDSVVIHGSSRVVKVPFYRVKRGTAGLIASVV